MKSGFVAILGRPNVGKSTLLNALLSKKISIVSPKAQTTRDDISGILNQKDLQIVFVDTPGIFTGAGGLDKYMNQSALSANKEVDATLYLIDASVDSLEKDIKILSSLNPKNLFIVLNKIDTIKPDRGIEIREELKKNFSYPIIEASLLENYGLKEIKDAILPLIPEGMPFYPENYITDKDKTYQIREIIRQELLHFLKQEVPHQSAVKIDSFNEENGGYIITATILVEKINHKGIVIGKGGQMIKKISMSARKELQRIWHEHINSLEIMVDVCPNWRNDPKILKELGYFND